MRRDRPELIDSELFGHEPGAFTGAVGRRKGWFEQADGGTLFLDEVGELALAAQVRLLRVVQDGEVVRVGGERPVRVNVRIVAATHRDLPAMVESQAFREDLYYRLSVFPIVIPPLRDRPADIRAFADYFADRAANRFGLRPVPVSDEDVRVLADYRWPGNVREMAAVMDRAVLIGQGQSLSVAAALGQGPRTPTPVIARASSHMPAGAIEPLDVMIRRHIESALDATHGRVEGPHGAARLLRINPHTLRARMRKLRSTGAHFAVAAWPLTGSLALVVLPDPIRAGNLLLGFRIVASCAVDAHLLSCGDGNPPGVAVDRRRPRMPDARRRRKVRSPPARTRPHDAAPDLRE